MSDYNEELSTLHQRVVRAALGLSAVIDDNYVEFKDADLGDMTINLRDYNPEFMRLSGVVFEDVKGSR